MPGKERHAGALVSHGQVLPCKSHARRSCLEVSRIVQARRSRGSTGRRDDWLDAACQDPVVQDVCLTDDTATGTHTI